MAKKKDSVAEPSDGTVAVNDAWTGMLVVSLVALVLGAAFLAYDMLQYSEQPPTVPKFASPSSLKKAADGGAPKVDGGAPKVEGGAPKVDDAKKDAEPKKD